MAFFACGQRVKAHAIYKVTIWVKVKCLQPVDIQNVELVQCSPCRSTICSVGTALGVEVKGSRHFL